MLDFIRSRKAKKALAAAVALSCVMAIAGCNKGGNKQQAPQATMVKIMQVTKRDTPVAYDFTGYVKATREIELKAQVSGQIKEKYFKGGDEVEEGQALYRIDSRTYSAALLNAEAAYKVAATNADRYNKLFEQHAVSKQTLDNALMQRDQALAALNIAQVNMDETIVVAPFSGRISTTNLEVGNYVAQGNTSLGNITNTDPVFIQFTIAEPEYIKLANNDNGGALDNLTAVLSDGTVYGLKGRVSEVNKDVTNGTGTITVKALFDNPKQQLLPGMFAHIKATSGVMKDALLIPKRAVVELMYKRFVYVVGADNKVTMKEVNLGPAVERMYVVTGGLKGDETIVVEGTGKIRQGSEVKGVPMTEADLDTTKPADTAAPK